MFPLDEGIGWAWAFTPQRPHTTRPRSSHSPGVVLRGEKAELARPIASAAAKRSSLTMAGTATSTHSSSGRVRRRGRPPGEGRYSWRYQAALPLKVGFRSSPLSVELAHTALPVAVGTPSS
ncbi:MAG TPA: hypothetical protein VNF71_15000 [Acidimicrobiales bacterium]|nr:hypothetical protein [Acidimicrobiales bacterium]